MANAIEWLRSKAATTVEMMVITPEEAAATPDGAAPGTYKVTRQYFSGTLPARMAHEVRKLASTLKNTETVMENVRIGGQYRSDFGRCEYWHTTYELV